MIWPLLRFSLRRLLSRVLAAAVCGMAGAMAALLLYNEPALEAITQMRSQAEPLFKALGVGGSASLSLHLVSIALGFYLPLVCLVFAVSAAAQLMAALVESGEMAHFLAAPKSRSAIVCTQAAALLLGVLAVVAMPFAAAMLGGLLLHPGLLSVPGVAAAFTGLLAMTAGAALFALMISANRDTALSARRRTHAWIGLAFVLWMLSRADNMLAYLSYVTPFMLYQPERLVLLRADGWSGAILFLLAGLICLVLGSVRFSRRDLPL